MRGIAAEIEGVAAFGREVGFWNEAGLADGVWPRLPAVAAALGGFFVVTGDGGVGGVVAVPDVPAGGKVGIGVEENEVREMDGRKRKIKREEKEVCESRRGKAAGGKAERE